MVTAEGREKKIETGMGEYNHNNYWDWRSGGMLTFWESKQGKRLLSVFCSVLLLYLGYCFLGGRGSNKPYSIFKEAKWHGIDFVFGAGMGRKRAYGRKTTYPTYLLAGEYSAIHSCIHSSQSFIGLGSN